MKIYTGAWVFICRHIQTKKHSGTKRHTVTTFHYKYAKKIIGSFLEMLPGIISEVEQLKSMPNQLANLCSIKVKQEFELMMLAIKAIYVNIFMYEPIKIMA